MLTKQDLLMSDPAALRRLARALRVPDVSTLSFAELVDSVQAVLDSEEFDMPHPFEPRCE